LQESDSTRLHHRIAPNIAGLAAQPVSGLLLIFLTAIAGW
jgi:hypothetical protein